jgi:small subunit ribosomal protein S4
MRFLTLTQKKSRTKPFFKQMIRLRENILLRKKILKFKKHKWKDFVFHAKRKLFKRYLKFKIRNTLGYCVSRKPNRWVGRKGRHRNLLFAYKKFKIFYGLFSKKAVKRIVRKVKKMKKKRLRLNLFSVMERRLDAVIYRSKFSYSSKSARQLIMHKNVTVNGNFVTNPAFLTKIGDLIQIVCNKKILVGIVSRSQRRLWPHPPSHLHINYKTLQIIIGRMDYRDLMTCFHFDLKPENMVLDYYYK